MVVENGDHFVKAIVNAKDDVEECRVKDEQSAFEVVKQIKNTELSIHIKKLDRLKQMGQLPPPDIRKLQFMKTAQYFPNKHKDMSFDDMVFATDKKHQMRAMKWIVTDEPLNRRSDEVYNMHNGKMPEETRFMQKSLEQITVALFLVNVDLKDETTKFDKHTVEPVVRKMEDLLNASLHYRGGRDQTKKTLSAIDRTVSKLRRELEAHGYLLKNKQVGSGGARYREYHVEIHPKIKELIPFYEMNTCKKTLSGTHNCGSLEPNPKKRRVTVE